MDTQQLCQRLVNSAMLSTEQAAAHLQAWQALEPKELQSAQPSAAQAGFLDFLVAKQAITELQRQALLEGEDVAALCVGPYRVFEQVAAGRLGNLFRAVHMEFRQPVCLKIFPAALKDNPEAFARMGRELRVSVEMQHANIVRTFDLGRVGDTHYLALEDLSGETLAARLQRDGFLKFEEACAIGRDVARGLAYIHEHDVIHRNLRPDNIWLPRSGGAKITEFGAARDPLAEIDKASRAMMTIADTVFSDYVYMAPEQAQDARTADARSDIYSLGAVIYQCLTGRPMFDEKNPMRLVMKLVSSEPPKVSELNDQVPVEFEDTMTGLIAKAPKDRFQKSKHAAVALEHYLPFQPEEVPELLQLEPVSSHYLEWVRAHPAAPLPGFAKSTQPIVPALAKFLERLSSSAPGKN